MAGVGGHPGDAGGDEDQPRQAGVGGGGAAAGHEAQQGLQPQARPRLLQPARLPGPRCQGPRCRLVASLSFRKTRVHKAADTYIHTCIHIGLVVCMLAILFQKLVACIAFC